MALTLTDIKGVISEAIRDEIKPLIETSIKKAIKNAIRDEIKPLIETSIKNAIRDEIRPILNCMMAKEQNSYAGCDDPLEWPPHTVSGVPHALEDGESISINCLLVAGNEKLPNGKKNTWNSEKSKAALLHYEIDGSESDPDDKSEYSEKSRARRLRVARVLGISRAQLNFAQLAL
jgi:hypothetical protein